MSESVAVPMPGTRRDRVRAATIEEIKNAAWQLMREHGTTDFKFSEVARLLGMTPPALYRYFADRDELLTALIVDAYRDLAQAVAAARDAVPPGDFAGRLLAVARAYREWARKEPQRFTLVFGVPVPGYAAPVEGPTSEAARQAMAQLSMIFREADRQGRLGRPLIREVGPALQRCVEEHEADDLGDFVEPADTFQAMLHFWAALHGITSLETYGHLCWLEPEARDELFLGQVRQAAVAAGLGPAVPG